ncbi:MAG: hypothetical protein ACKPKO_00355, partial [Candidatus Fonsibacter sp.]
MLPKWSMYPTCVRIEGHTEAAQGILPRNHERLAKVDLEMCKYVINITYSAYAFVQFILFLFIVLSIIM